MTNVAFGEVVCRMYFRTLELDNIGPIDQFKLDFPFSGDKPIPIILVGENGSGKSILLSHLVNSLMLAKQAVFEDTEVEKDKVFKYRAPNYVKTGKFCYRSMVRFNNNSEIYEWQLRMTRKAFEEKLQYTPLNKDWNTIPENETSWLSSTFQHNKSLAEDIFREHCCLYFPVNRFEEPAWLNLENLKGRPSFSELKHLSGYSNRSIICSSPMRSNINWLLDLILDSRSLEMKLEERYLLNNKNGIQSYEVVQILTGYEGKANTLYNSTLQVLNLLFGGSGNIRFGFGTREFRIIQILKDNMEWIPNLFHLSTGEALVLNMFLSILRDFDLSRGTLQNISDVSGIIVIDEIDAHLHVALQRDVLPKLISYFPKVQFIITTHSPLFLLGMEKQFGSDGFHILNLPDGKRVMASDFSEFETAYTTFKETSRYRDEIKKELEKEQKPIVFVEGDYDIQYIRKAADLLFKANILEKVHLKDGGGYGNLDKIWKSLDNPLSSAIPNKILLLYDCDTKKNPDTRNMMFKRTMETLTCNPIAKGIENLFPSETIIKLQKENQNYIDSQEALTRTIRGQTSTTPRELFVNRDEKKNICSWLCLNGTVDDFVNFGGIFDIIEDFLRYQQ